MVCHNYVTYLLNFSLIGGVIVQIGVTETGSLNCIISVQYLLWCTM